MKDLGLNSLYRENKKSHKRNKLKQLPHELTTTDQTKGFLQAHCSSKEALSHTEQDEDSSWYCNSCEKEFKSERGLKSHKRFCGITTDNNKFEKIIDDKLAETK